MKTFLSFLFLWFLLSACGPAVPPAGTAYSVGPGGSTLSAGNNLPREPGKEAVPWY